MTRLSPNLHQLLLQSAFISGSCCFFFASCQSVQSAVSSSFWLFPKSAPICVYLRLRVITCHLPRSPDLSGSSRFFFLAVSLISVHLRLSAVPSSSSFLFAQSMQSVLAS